MRLIDAYNLLVDDGISDNQRYFSEIYKYFRFTDDQLLKEYLDFIAVEPTEWMRGFPAKLNSKQTFSKPKTAVIKLLKKDAVKQALGEQYVEEVYEKIWQTFKKDGEKILAEREKKPHSSGSSQQTTLPISQFFGQFTKSDPVEEDNESYESLPLPVLRGIRESTADPMSETSSIDHETVETPSREKTDRVQLLKQVASCLIQSLDPNVAKAFQILLSEV